MPRIKWTCQNCWANDYAPSDRLPEGWRWFALSDRLDGQMNDVEAPLLCKTCVKRIDAALKFEKHCGLRG